MRVPGNLAAPCEVLYFLIELPITGTKHLRLSTKMEKMLVLTSIFGGFSEWVCDPVAMATWYVTMQSCGKGGLFIL